MDCCSSRERQQEIDREDRQQNDNIMSTIVPNRVTSSTASSSSSSQIKHEHIKDENNNNSITKNDSSNNTNNDSFFENWKVGNWCWERDYNKYPVILFPHQCHDDKGITDRRSNDAKINTKDGPSDDNVQNGDDDDNDNDNNDIDDDDKKPAAIKASALDSSRLATTSSGRDATTSTIEKATATKKKDVRKISGCRIKKEKKEEGADTTNGFNNNNNDDDYDDSFYDDWVEGNWCLLNNCDNNSNDNSNNDSSCKSIPTTRSRKKRTRNNNNTNKKSTTRMSKRKRDDENSYNEGNDGDDGDEEYLLEDNDDERIHQEKDKRPANIRAQLLTYEQTWIGMYQKLVEYKKEHGNTIVPQRYDEDPKFGLWVSKQRCLYKTDKLLSNRYALLNSVGFKVENYDQIWMGMFEKLVQYKKQHKNTIVPSKYNNDPKLGNWVSEQRRHYKNNELLPKRLAPLNSIGFARKGVVGGKVDNEKWMNMFQKLSAYKKQHKNTVVPKQYNRDPTLGRWVSKQRHFYNYNELHPERLALLNSIDFN